MRIRHSNMLAMAQFLCTKSEPKLVSIFPAIHVFSADSLQYYKPWELLPGDAERIKEQIADTEALIEREILEFNRRHMTELQPEGRPREEEAKNEAAETEGEHHAESSPVPRVAESDTTNPLLPTVQAQAPAPERAQEGQVLAERDPLEENGEVVVEGDEDTVIY